MSFNKQKMIMLIELVLCVCVVMPDYRLHLLLSWTVYLVIG